MTKVANAYYSTAVAHKQVEGLFQATFGIPGEPPEWVNDAHGKPQIFRSAEEAMLAGFKRLVSRLNRTRQDQDFHVKGSPPVKNTIKSWSAPKDTGPTIDSVFGRK
jgi:hypothetical protein